MQSRGEIGIVRATLNDHLLFDEDLILPVQVKPSLDRDWTVCGEGPFGHVRAHERAHLPSGIRVQFEFPLDTVGRCTLARRRLETPILEPSLHHVQREIPRQVGEMKPRERVGGFGHQCDRCRGGCRKRHDGSSES